MSNNPYITDLKNHINQTGDKDKLREMCDQLQLSQCPCVGRDSLPGKTVRLISTHPGYPDYQGNPCINTIGGEQLQTTPEYKECLLAATCQYFFPDTKKKFDDMCKNPRECNIPRYVGFGSQSADESSTSRW